MSIIKLAKITAEHDQVSLIFKKRKPISWITTMSKVIAIYLLTHNISIQTYSNYGHITSPIVLLDVEFETHTDVP